MKNLIKRRDILREEILDILGTISLIAVFYYLVQWYDNKNKSSDFDLVRNHLRRITHPNLVVQGHGRYFIEYQFKDRHVVEYFKYIHAYNEELKNKRQNPIINPNRG